MKQYDFGVIGLGVMGQNLALNIANHGFKVAGFDLDEKQRKASDEKWSGKEMATFPSLKEIVEALTTPRRILIMVPAGKAVDSVINDLRPLLSKGDVLIDGGNSFFQDTDRRSKELSAAGFHFIGAGVSGGEEGALHGPSIMPGGPEEAYRHVEEILTSIAAQVEDGPCCAYIGKGGAGHYVKMVHNGMEYGIMQLLCETYDLMQRALGMPPAEMSPVFAKWNQGELSSYLVEITADILSKNDPETGKPMVDVIYDTAGQKGTGKWTSQNALDLGIAILTINAGLEARILSAIKQERVEASKVIEGPGTSFEGNREKFLEDLRRSLRLSVLVCYAQGFALLREASKEYDYQLDFPSISRTWKGGCIIRAKLLDSIQKAFEETPDLKNLLIDQRFAPVVKDYAGSLRAVVGEAARLGIPVLAFSSALGYIDSYRTARLPANLLQAQRDYFGAHTFERLDKPRGEKFHFDWVE